MTQTQQIYKHLKRYAGITTLTAFEKYGITRLSARIWDLRSEGHDIVSVPKEVTNRYGDTCHVTEYRLRK